MTSTTVLARVVEESSRAPLWKEIAHDPSDSSTRASSRLGESVAGTAMDIDPVGRLQTSQVPTQLYHSGTKQLRRRVTLSLLAKGLWTTTREFGRC